MAGSRRRLNLIGRSDVVAQSGLALQEAERRFLDEHRRHNHSPETIKHYEQTFTVFRTFLAAVNKPDVVGALTSSTFASFHHWLEETPLQRPYRGQTRRSLSGIHGCLKDLRAFSYWLVEAEILSKPPKVVMPKLPEEEFTILTEAQLLDLFSCRQLTGNADGAVRNRALIAFLLDTGVRLSEVARLTLEHLHIDEGVSRILGKGSKIRHVFFTESTATYLRLWMTRRHPEETTVFGLTTHGIKMLMRRIARDTGLNIHAHLFRHTAATMMVTSDMDLHSVRKVMGHSHLSVTEKYLSLSHAALRAKHAAASPMAQLQEQMDAPKPLPKRRRYVS